MQRDDLNGTHRALPEDQYGTVECKCGSKEFELIPIARVMYDRLQPTEFRFVNGTKLRCLVCGLYVRYSADERRWITFALKQ